MYDQEKVLSFVRPSIGDCLFDLSKGVDVMLIKRPAYFAHVEQAKDYRIMEISGHSESSTPSASPSDDRAASPAVTSPSATSAKLRAVCKFCGKSFVHLGDYNKHQRKHTGERPYSCAECPLKFGNASNLARHRRLHSGEKPFECPTCSRGFSRRDKLTAHVARRCCKPAADARSEADAAS